MYRDVPRIFVPVLWFEQHVKMSESIANEIKFALNMPLMGQIMGIVMFIIGLITLLIIPLLSICQKRTRRKVKDFDINQNIFMTEKKVVEANGSPESKNLLGKEALYGISVK